jgi:hypothetical protein
MYTDAASGTIRTAGDVDIDPWLASLRAEAAANFRFREGWLRQLVVVVGSGRRLGSEAASRPSMKTGMHDPMQFPLVSSVGGQAGGLAGPVRARGA